MRAVRLAYLVADYREVAATQTGRKLQPHSRCVNVVNLYRHYLLELFNLLLHLNGFRRLVAEALYESLHVGYLLLLVFVGSQLLLTSLRTQLDIFVVLHLVVYDTSAGNLQRPVGDIIYKGTVVTYKDDGTGTLCQELLQPLNTLNVEVVSGLVEKQHVGALKKNLRQLYTHTPSAGELRRRAVEISAFETQSQEGALHLGIDTLRPHHLVAFLLFGIALQQFHVALALVVGTLVYLFVKALYALFLSGSACKSLTCLLANGGLVLEVHNLWQVTHRSVVGNGDGSCRRLLLTAENFQHRRFPCSVLADKGNTVAVVDDETDAVEQRFCTKFYFKSFY